MDAEFGFGFAAYCRMIRFNDEQPEACRLPRMAPLAQPVTCMLQPTLARAHERYRFETNQSICEVTVAV